MAERGAWEGGGEGGVGDGGWPDLVEHPCMHRFIKQQAVVQVCLSSYCVRMSFTWAIPAASHAAAATDENMRESH